MYQALGMDFSSSEWRRAAADHLRRRLGADVMGFVVDDPTCVGRLVATGAGSIAARFPGPGNLSARVRYIQWVSTDVAWRRRGLARAITSARLDWFADQECHQRSPLSRGTDTRLTSPRWLPIVEACASSN